MSEMCCTQLAENAGRKKISKNSRSGHHRTTLLGCVFTTKACIDNRKKNLLNSNMVNFGPLTAEIGLGVCSTPTDFNGFRVLLSLQRRRRSPEANQSLHDVWPSAGLVHCLYFFGGLLPLTEFCHVQNILCV